jgi:hypothetical protein
MGWRCFRTMADENPAELRAKIIRYRELLGRVTDNAARKALEDMIKRIKEKLNGHEGPPMA